MTAWNAEKRPAPAALEPVAECQACRPDASEGAPAADCLAGPGPGDDGTAKLVTAGRECREARTDAPSPTDVAVVESLFAKGKNARGSAAD